jgi:hypothetical protein
MVLVDLISPTKHMSPKTMAALPKSPAGARRSSSGSGLRPVLPFGLDDENAVDADVDDELLGPVPRDQSSPFAAGAGVDEVEYAYGQATRFLHDGSGLIYSSHSV